MDKLNAQADDLWRIFLTLPLTTQFAVVLLFVSGLVVHLFKYNSRTVHDGPSIFTTAGIFFTFLGIAEGLYGFDPAKIDASVPLLLNGLKTAFIASVVGVGVALTIKLRFALFGLRTTQQSKQTEGATVDDLLSQLIAVENSIVGDDDSTLLSQMKLSRQDTNDRLDRLLKSHSDFSQKLAENNSKALIEALKDVIKEFNTKLTEQFGENFKQLNVAVGQLLTWQQQYRIQISEMIKQQSDVAKNMDIATDRYSTVISKTETFATLSNTLSGLLTGLETQRTQITESLKSLAQLIVKASDGLPQIENKITQLTQQITSGVKQNQDDMTKTLRDTTVALQNSVADLRKQLAEAMQLSNQQINDHVKQLSDRTTDQIVKLDAALETELTRSISSLGRQLTALSAKFVEDYGPLTDSLRSLMQSTRGAQS